MRRPRRSPCMAPPIPTSGPVRRTHGTRGPEHERRQHQGTCIHRPKLRIRGPERRAGGADQALESKLAALATEVQGQKGQVKDTEPRLTNLIEDTVDATSTALDTFEQHYSMNHEETRDGRIEMMEWLEYYNNVSMSIDNDQYFELMMNNTWNLDGSRVTKKGWGGEV